MKKNKGIFLICAIILCSILIVFANNTTYAYAQDAVENSYSENFDNYTDSDEFNYNNINYSIYEYKSKLYCKNIKMIDTSIQNKWLVEINGDDPIINIVPKEAFAEEGEHFYIGKEYGFFVYTEPEYCFGVQNTHVKTGHNTVYVLVFNIINNINLQNNGVISIKIQPIFQYEYKYIVSDKDYYIAQYGNGFILDAPDKAVDYRLNGNKGVVIPAGRIDGNKIFYSEIERFYLKDMSIGLSVYNEQDYNKINGELYDPNKDIGSYFTYFDYQYDGIVRRNGEFPLEEAITLEKDALDLMIGYLKTAPGVGNVVSFIDNVISTVEITEHVFEFGEGLINFATEQNIEVSSGKITATNFHANRDDQLNKYGDIIKTISLTVNSNNESIWYGSGDYCIGYFKLSHSALNGEVPEYTRLYRDIGLKVTDTYGNEFAETSSFYYYLREPKSEDVKENAEADIILLPDGVNYFHCCPEFSGDYEITIDGVSDYSLYMNDSQIYGNNNKYQVKMKKGQDYYFRIDKIGAGALGKFKINIEDSTSDITLDRDDVYITKVKGDGFYNLKTSDPDVVISKIYEINNGKMELSEISPNVASGSVPIFLMENKDYYAVLQNTTSDEKNVDLIFKEAEKIMLNSEEEVFIDKNGVYLSFTASKQGAYILSALSNTGIATSFFDENGERYTVDSRTNNYWKFDISGGQTIYVKIVIGNNVTGSISLNIKESQNAFAWYLNGNLVANRTVKIKRGTSVNLYCMVNNSIKIEDFMPVAHEKYGEYVTINGGAINVYPRCKVGGEGFYLVAINANDGSKINILPEFEGNINIKDIVNTNTDIGFYWQQKPDIQKISIKAKLGNDIKSIDCLGSTNENQYIYKSIYSYYKNIESCGEIEISVVSVQIKNVNGQLITKDCQSNKLYVNCSFYGGKGTSSSPFTISTVRHFNNISRFSGSEYKFYYKLSATIDFGGNAPQTSNLSFYGNLSGAGIYSLRNIKISSTKDSVGGLFYKNYGEIHNFIGINVTITANSNNTVGGVVAENHGRIYQNGVSGSIVSSGKAMVGGVAGTNMGEIDTVPTMVDITSKSRTGGITATNSGMVKLCSYNKTINVDLLNSSLNGAGGIVGYNGADAEVGTCFAFAGFKLNYTGASSESRTLAPALGQIVGENHGGVNSCKGEGSINKGSLHTVTWKEYEFPWWKDYSHDQAKYVGGLIGRNF